MTIPEGFSSEGDPHHESNDIFSSIRNTRNTTLENQKQAITLLDAIEQPLALKNLDKAPENYFFALWPLFNSEVAESKITKGKGQAEILNHSAIYLLSFVFPALSAAFIVENYGKIYETLGHAMERYQHNAPMVRSCLSCLRFTLRAFPDEDVWKEKDSLVELFSLILGFAVDERPKVRKIAQEIALENLQNKCLIPIVAQYCKMILQGATRKVASTVLHIIPLLVGGLKFFDQINLDNTIGPLFHCAALGNTFLTTSIYSVITALFEADHASESRVRLNQSQVKKIYAGLIRLRPELSLSALFIPWIAAFSRATFHYPTVVGEPSQDLLILFSSLESSDEKVHLACQYSMAQIPSILVNEELFNIIANFLCFKTVPASFGYLMAILRDLTINHEFPLPINVLKLLCSLYDRKDMGPFRTDLCKAIGELIKRFGPKEVLDVVPLNLESVSRTEDNVIRAWMLPILKDYVFNTSFEYFTNVLFPITKRLQAKVEGFRKEQKDGDAKIYETLIFQIWSLLPGFLQYPIDFSLAFPPFASQLGICLNSDLQLRPILANGIVQFIQRFSNFEIDVESHSIKLYRHIDSETVENDLKTLGSFAPQFLPLLFNIYGTLDTSQRGYFLNFIESFLSISAQSTVKEYFDKILQRVSMASDPTESAALLELGCSMVSLLQFDAYKCLFDRAISIVEITSELTLQKRAYKALSIVFAHELFGPTIFSENIQTLEQALAKGQEVVTVAGKKGRFRLLLQLAPFLPDEHLYWIPLFLPEAILGTKEINQKSRLYSFELMLAWGRRMGLGGECKAESSHGILENDLTASLSEFITMLIAGLAGKTPHMISATLLSLSRVIFEFSGTIDQALIQELLKDVVHLFGSASREVVKSVFGFIKVIIVALDPTILQPYLQSLVSGVLEWSEEHSLHFKVRVRHLIERLVRKYGYDIIYKLVPEDHKKLVTNIRKRKERLRRKKAVMQETESNNQAKMDELSLDSLTEAAISRTTLVARGQVNNDKIKSSARFERTMYDSESELEDDDEDKFGLAEYVNIKDEDIETVLSKKLSLQSKRTGNSKANKQDRKNVAGSMAVTRKDSHIKTLADGKLLIEESDQDYDEDEDGGVVFDPTMHDLYAKSLNNNLKSTRKRASSRDEESDNDDGQGDNMRMGNTWGGTQSGMSRLSRVTKRSSITNNRSSIQHSGQEFKSKKGAGGDFRPNKSKFEPYAYVPLQRSDKKKKTKSTPNYFLSKRSKRA